MDSKIKLSIQHCIEDKEDHIIWKGVYGAKQYDYSRHAPHQWYYMMQHDTMTPPYRLRKTCNIETCVKHWEDSTHPKKRKRDWTKTDDLLEMTVEKKQKTKSRLLKKTIQVGTCYLWQGGKNQHYGSVGIGLNTYYVHVAMYVLTTQNKPLSSQVVRHLCGNSLCVNPEHLKLGNYVENAQDKEKHGTTLRGARNPNTTITEEIALLICKSKGTGTQQERSLKFGVTKAIVNSIDNGRSWNHVTGKQKTISKRKRTPIDQINRCTAKSYIEHRIVHEQNHWIWTNATNKDGYGVSHFENNQLPAHVLSYIAYNEEIPPKGLVVRHICKSKNCVNPQHLELGTVKQNAQDRLRDGTQPIGEMHPMAKLTENDVVDIRNSDKSLKDLALQYSVAEITIKRAQNKQNWTHV